MKYNDKQTVKIMVHFDSLDEEKQYQQFRKSKDIIPVTVGGLDFVRGKWMAAHYTPEDATEIIKWLKSKKANYDKKLYL